MSRANVTSGGEDPSAAPGDSQWGEWGGFGALSGVSGGAQGLWVGWVGGCEWARPGLLFRGRGRQSTTIPEPESNSAPVQEKWSTYLVNWSIGRASDLQVHDHLTSSKVLVVAILVMVIVVFQSSQYSTTHTLCQSKWSEVLFAFFFLAKSVIPISMLSTESVFPNLGITRIRYFQPLCQTHF